MDHFEGLKLKFKRLHPDAVLPTRAKAGDAGMDLTAAHIISHHRMVEVHFGLAVEIPKGYVGLIFPRSSIYKTDTRLSNAVGVIDSGYRGGLKVYFDIKSQPPLDLLQEKPYAVGDRCAQLVVVPYNELSPCWADELTPTERGSGGFGSSGQ